MCAYSDLASWQSTVTAGTPAATRFTAVSGASPVSMNVGNFSPGTARSFEFVFNAAGAGPSKTLLGSADPASGGQFLKLNQWNNSGKFGVTTSGVADDAFLNSPTRSNQQVHAVFVSSGSVTSLYLNGVLQTGTISRALAITGTNGLAAFDNAAHTTFSDNLDGTITGFASYARALSQAEVTARFNALVAPPPLPTPNLAAWQAVVNGGTAATTRFTSVAGSSPVSMSVGTFAAGTARSFEFVFNAAGAGPTKTLLGSADPVSGGQFLKLHQWNNTGKFGVSTSGVADEVFANSPTLSNQHVHAVFTSNGSVTSLYLNGVLQTGTIERGLAITGTNGLGAFDNAAHTTFSDNLDGSISGFASYARALSQAEVTARFNALATTNTVPGAPVIGTATILGSSATVAFTPPASNGGTAITGYTATSSPGGLTGTGTSSPITVSGLEAGTSYTFTVTATNAVGTGPASAASNAVVNNNFPPTGILLSNNAIQEGNAVNATIGALSAVDPSATDSHNFTLVSGAGSTDNGSFTISGSNLRITPVSSAAAKSSYALRIRATDQAGGFVEKRFTVRITAAVDIPEAFAGWRQRVQTTGATATHFTTVAEQNPVTVDVGNFADGSARSFEFVFHARGSGPYRTLLAAATPVGQSQSLRFNQFSNTQKFGVSTSGVADDVFANSPTRENQLVHAVFVSNGSVTSLFLNGVLQTATIARGLTIKGSNVLGFDLDGVIYGFASYNKALTQGEISSHAQGIVGLGESIPVQDFNLPAWQAVVSQGGATRTRFTPVSGSNPQTVDVGTFAANSPRSFEFVTDYANMSIGVGELLAKGQFGDDTAQRLSVVFEAAGQRMRLSRMAGTNANTGASFATQSSNQVKAANQKVHLVFVSPGSWFTDWYLNGVKQERIQLPLSFTGTYGLGASSVSFPPFFQNAIPGTIHGFASYSSELSQAQVSQRFQALASSTPIPTDFTNWETLVSADTPAVTRFTPVLGSSPVSLSVGSFAAGTPRSFEFLFNAAGAGPSKTLLGSLDGASGGQSLKLNQWNNTNKFGLTTSGVADEVFTNSTTLSNQVVHAVFVSNGSITNLYLNGVLQSAAVSRAMNITGINGLGAADNAAHTGFFDNLDGSILRFASYGRALTQAEITQRQQALNASLNITAWRKQVSAARPAAKYFPTLSGASPIRLNVGNFAVGAPRSFEFVCRAAGAGPSKALLGSQDTNSGAQILQLNQFDNTQRFGVTTSSVGDELFSSSVTTSNQVAHVVFVSDGTVTKLFVNGQLQMRSIPRGLAITGINALGAYDNAAHDAFLGNLDGTIEGFASYGRELSAAEITARFQTLQDDITAPGAPVIGSALGQDAAAIVSFGAPVNNGGAEITGYTVTSSPGGITATGTRSPITVTGLTNGVSYTFTVTATNSVGTGAASAASNAVVPDGEINIAPTDILLLSNTVPDGNTANATVGALVATDANLDDTHTFTLVSGTGSTDNANFTISGNALRITPVTNAVTKSSYSLRLRATDGGNLFFEKALTVRVVATGATAATFAPSQLHIQPSFNYKQTVTGNFDGDGIPDIAAITTHDQCVVLFSTQGYLTPNGYNSGRISSAIAVGDVNNDGILDLIVGWGVPASTPTAGVVAYLGSGNAVNAFGNGTIELISLPNPALNTFPSFLSVTDLNGDQKPDIIVQRHQELGFSTYRKNDTQWGYDFVQESDTGYTPVMRGAVTADFNEDGVVDVAHATSLGNGSSKVSVLTMGSSGNFSRTDMFTVAAEIQSIAAADLNGDGRLDLAIAAGNGANGQLLLARNSRTALFDSISFATPTTLTTGTAGLLGIRCADMNRDGKQDVITSENQQLRVFFGNGDMTVTASTNNPISVPTTSNGSGGISMNFEVGDFSNDGMIDLFAGNGQLLTNLRGALFAPKPLNLFAGLGQAARPGVPLRIGSAPLQPGFTAASTVPWLSVTPTNGLLGISSLVASADPAALALGRHRGKVNLSSPDLQATEVNVTMDVAAAAGTLGASQIVPIPADNNWRSPVASGDFNNDGRLDFVHARLNVPGDFAFGFRVLLTGSNGSFTAVNSSSPSNLQTTTLAQVVTGDFNGDSHLDVAGMDIVSSGVHRFQVAHGNGTGALGNTVHSAVIGRSGLAYEPVLEKNDFNGDGKDDLVIIHGGEATMLLGTSSGVFRKVGVTRFLNIQPGVTGQVQAVASGDFNGDGSCDLMVDNFFIQGDGLGGLRRHPFVSSANSQLYKVKAGDFNGDNITDALYWRDSDLRVSYGSSTLNTVSGGGALSYLTDPVLVYNANASGYSIRAANAADVNGDGILDLVSTANSSNVCITLLGNGDGTFQTAKVISRTLYGGDHPLHVGDVSGDGAPDVFQINGNGHDIWEFNRLSGQSASTTTTLATTGGGTGLFGGVAPVTVTVAATTPSAAFSTPLGSVSLKKGSTVVATSTRYTAGTWTFTPVGLGVGSHTLTAQYDGDLRNAPSISGSVTVNIVKGVADITLASSLGVSEIGDTVTFSANISPVTSGSISFFNGTTLLGTGTIDASGLATYTTSSLPTGSNSITASFAGNSDVHAAISSPLTQTVNKLPATVTLKNLLASFDGSAKSAGADTLPAGLPVTFTYNGSATAPSGVGSYTVVATVDDSTYQGSETGTFVIQKGTAGISIANVNRIFDGSPKPVSVTTTPADLPFTISYNGSGTAPSAIGSYPVVVTINSPNYQGTASDTLVISAAAVTTTTLTSSANPSPFLTPPTFTATVSSASATPGGEMQLLIDNVLFEAKQVNASGVATFSPPATLLAGGSRSIRANYNANGAVAEFAPSNAIITQVVEKAEVEVTLDAPTLDQTYNGSARVVTASVTPPPTHASVQVDITYDGSSIAPINAGTYAVVATINDPSLEGSVSGTLIVSKAAVALESGPLTVGYTGQAISPTLRVTPDVPFTVTYDATTSGIPAGNPTASPPINAGNYRILVSVGSNYELTPPHLPLYITKRGVGISLSNLSVIADGTTPQPVVAVTHPPGINLNIQYTNAAGGSPSNTPPSTAGLWNVSATVSNSNYEGSVTAQLRLRTRQNTRVVLNGPSTELAGRSLRYNALLVNADNLPAPASGPAPFPEGTPAPSGIITFKQGGTVIGSAQLNVNGEVSLLTGFPPRPAPYNITAEYGGSEDFFPTTNSNTIQTTVTKIPITPIAESPLVVTYDGLPKEVKFTTSLGKARKFKINVTYAGSASLPINASANLIPVVATIDDPDYQGTTTVQLRIDPAPATITVGNTFATFDGSPKPVSVITNPPNLPVTITYGGSTTAPSATGVHPLSVQLNITNYTAPVFTGSLTISAGTSKITISDLTHVYDGNRKQVKVHVDPPAPFTVTYDGFAQVPTEAGIYDVNVELFGGERVGRATAKMIVNGSISARAKDYFGIDITINGQSAYDPLSLAPGFHVMRVNNQPLGNNPSGQVFLAFDRWADGSTDNPRYFLVGKGAGQLSRYHFTAVMKEKRYIKPEIDGPGTITGEGLYDENELYTSQVTPEPGYVVTNWRNSSTDLDNFSLKLRAKAGQRNRPVAVLAKGTAVTMKSSNDAWGSVRGIQPRLNENFPASEWVGDYMGVKEGRSFRVRAEERSGYTFTHWSVTGANVVGPAIKIGGVPYIVGIEREFTPTASECTVVANFVKNEPRFDIAITDEGDDSQEFELLFVPVSVQLGQNRYFKVNLKNVGNATANTVQIMGVRVTAMAFKPSAGLPSGFEVDTGGFHTFYFESLHPSEVVNQNDNDAAEFFLSKKPLNRDTSPTNIGAMFPGSPYTRSYDFDWPSFSVNISILDVASVNVRSLKYRVTAFVRSAETGDVTPVSIWVR
ncbi:MAG: MBG domain-containing protein [Akkermansiaceae bacterium]|nr:MBG domain-containing protein [Akkermansiaceae bacterium]